MFKYRPVRGSLDEAMHEEKTFDTMDKMFDYISKDPMIDKEDLLISENLGKDDRIDWLETRHILVKRYGSNVFDTPQCIGYCSMEDFNHLPYLTASKKILISGISRYHLLKMLYDAAKPYDKTITIEEAADALHNTIDMVTELKGKKLYVNVFGDTFDGSAYDSYNGIGLSYHIVCQMRHRLLFGDPVGIFEYHRRVAGPGPDDTKDDHSPTLPFSDPSRLQEIFDKVSRNNKIPDAMIYKSALKTIDSGISIPVQIVYKITCNVGFDTDFILIKATDEREAWDKFWEHAVDEPNLNHDDLGSKENYERVPGSWKKRGSIVSITIEPIHPTTDFLYIGGGRNV